MNSKKIPIAIDSIENQDAKKPELIIGFDGLVKSYQAGWEIFFSKSGKKGQPVAKLLPPKLAYVIDHWLTQPPINFSHETIFLPEVAGGALVRLEASISKIKQLSVRLDWMPVPADELQEVCATEHSNRDNWVAEMALKSFTQQSIEGLMLLDRKGNIQAFNKKLHQEFECLLNQKPMIGFELNEVFAYEINRQILRVWNEAIDGKVQVVEVSSKQEDDLRRFRIYVHPVFEENRVEAIQLQITDISAENHMLRLGQEANHLLNLIFNHSGVGICVFGSKGNKLLNVNKYFCELVGLNDRDLLNQSFPVKRKLIKKTEDSVLFYELPYVLTKQGNEVKIHKHPDKEIVVFGTCNSLDNSEGGKLYVVSVSDISKIKEAEAEISKLSLVAQRTLNGVLITNELGKIEWVNKSLERITGYTAQELQGTLPGTKMKGYVTGYDVMNQIRESVKKGTQFSGNIMSFNNQGLPNWQHLDLNPIFNSKNQLTQFIGIQTDITQSKVIEESLRNSELLYKTIAKSFPNGIISVIDQEFNIQFIDGEKVDQGELVGKELIGNNLLRLFDKETSAKIQPLLMKAFVGYKERIEIDTADKSFIYTVAPIPNAEREIEKVMVISLDITAQKQTEREVSVQREYLRQIIDTDPNWIFVKNEQGDFILANKAMAEFLNCTVEEFILNPGDKLQKASNNTVITSEVDRKVLEHKKPIEAEEILINKVTGAEHRFYVIKTPLKRPDGKTYILGVATDITARKNAEIALEEQKNYLRQILDTDPNVIFVKDRDGRFIIVNKAFADFYGKPIEELVGLRDEDLQYESKQIAFFKDTDLAVFDTMETFVYEETNINPVTKKPYYYLSTKKPLIDSFGNLFVLGVAVDITKRKEDEQKLLSKEMLLQEVFETAADALYLIDPFQEKIIDCNFRAVTLLGETNKDEVLNSLRQLFISETLCSIDLPGIFQQLKLKETWGEELLITSKSGKQFWANLAASKFISEGKELNLLRINDITERVKTEEQIKHSLHEKEILIQEIHHRVKNNIAVISSLLHLQSGYIEDPSLIDVFKDSQSRIKSMALIHEKLYQSKTLALVEFESYIRELTRTILYSYSPGDAKVRIENQIDNVYLDINSAVPCGLIVNELLSNACKHAFKGRTSGLIEVSFVKDGDMFKLEVKDNGIGLPPHFELENAKSLGMTLVYALTSQLNATIEFNSSSTGTCFRIAFKEKTKKNYLASN